MLEYRLVVSQEARRRVRVTLEQRPAVPVHAQAPAWRESGVAGAGETVFEALAKLGAQAERVGDVRADLRRRVGQVG